MAKITLIGMYNFDQTLFDNLTLPTGIEKSTLVDNILIRSGEFEVLYPDMDYLKFAIGAWSRKWRPTFDRWQKALEIEYKPLENYDRIEEWEENGDKEGSETNGISGNASENSAGSNTNEVTGSEGTKHQESHVDNTSDNETENTSGSTTNKQLQVGSSSGSTSGTTSSTTDTDKSAYDSATLVNVEELRVSGADSSSNSASTSMSISDIKTDSIVVSRIKAGMLNSSINISVSAAKLENMSGTNTLTVSKTHTENLKKALSEMNKLTHQGRTHGNIGVTTSQMMLKSELDLGYWNIYEKITDLFLTEFVIPIY